MRSSTIGILLLLIGAIVFASGLDWLAIVFVALGLAFLFLFKKVRELPANYETTSQEPQAQQPQYYPQQPIVLVDQSAGQTDMAEKIEEHIMLEKMLGGQEQREHEKEKKKMEKEIKELKKEIKHIYKKHLKPKKKEVGH